jgi:plasmid stability protein
MNINLSIKNVPEDIAARLRARAASNHRSLQGELMAILKAVASSPPGMSIDDIWSQGAGLGLTAEDESARIVRAMRDAR